MGVAGRRVEGEGLVKGGGGLGKGFFGEDMFDDVELVETREFLWFLVLLKKLDIRSSPILLFVGEGEMILGDIEERGEIEHGEICVVKGMIDDHRDWGKNKEIW